MDMNKKGFMMAAMAIVLGLCCACSKKSNKDANEIAEKDSVEVLIASDSLEALYELADSIAEEDETLSGGGGLNDIRFANFKTNKDWLDNEYIRTLRRYLDDYTAGKVENAELEPYKEGLKSKFVIYNTEPFIMGGLFIRVIFLDMPDKVFAGWVYSLVDEAKQTVTGYEFRALHLETEESGLTKEEILQGVKETPDLKLW